jgi:hypothetical protein
LYSEYNQVSDTESEGEEIDVIRRAAEQIQEDISLLEHQMENLTNNYFFLTENHSSTLALLQ